MYFDDHHPPHFHAIYAGDQAAIEIETLAVIAGDLPSRALGLVMDGLPSTERNYEKLGTMPQTCSQPKRLNR